VNRGRAALGFPLAAAVGLVLVSGGSGADPRTPAALPGMPPPFLGTALSGNGRLTAAVDAYGDVVDLRPSPAGAALIDNPSDRQAAGTVAPDTGIVPRVRVAGGPAWPFWRADSVEQRYVPGTNIVRTTARFGPVRASVSTVAVGRILVLAANVAAPGGTGAGAAARLPARVSFEVSLVEGAGLSCRSSGGRVQVLLCAPGGASVSGESGPRSLEIAARIRRRAATADRAWLAQARRLGPAAPAWARRLYGRSLLTLRALSAARTGAVAAGARDGWAYVWPRDAATAALAFAAAGYPAEARRAAHFLLDVDLGAAARFDGHGRPVAGRAAQGDASGWAAVAARASGLPAPSRPEPWRERSDYQEGPAGTYLANAIAATSTVDGPERRLYGGKSARQREGRVLLDEFGIDGGLVRRAGEPGSGLDSAAAWAVRPFKQPALFAAARETMAGLLADRTPFGITPGEGWSGGEDPWTAPTAWTAWSFAALAREDVRAASGLQRRAAGDADRRRALALLADLRRTATAAGELPERVDSHSGIARSTTPLAWSHAFAVLALRELWPGRYSPPAAGADSGSWAARTAR